MSEARYLGIVGPSGSGKTELMRRLLEQYPSVFFKVDQVTTREIRDDETGDTYVWLIRKPDYEKLKHLLIAKTEVVRKTGETDYYGSIPKTVDGKIGIIILNERGLDDLLANVRPESVLVVGLNRPLDELPRREGRDEEYIMREMEVLKRAHFVFDTGRRKWVNPKDVRDLAVSYFFPEGDGR